MNNLKIEEYKKGEEEEVSLLIQTVYNEFVSIDYSDEGNKFFNEWIEPAKIADRQKSQINILVAFVDSQLVGMIEIRENKYISLLFVDKNYQRQGIAKSLFEESLKRSIDRDPTIDMFYVHASPFSIPIYKRLGFVETDDMQEQFGIKYMPMKNNIKRQQ